MFDPKSVKTQLILYLVFFALFLAVKDRDTVFLRAALIAVAAAVVLESLILYLKEKKLQITESAVISGLIIGYVLASDEAWWKLVFAAALAILSKHIIRLRGKHIFNPAALGIFLTLVLPGASTQWKGTYLWYVLVPLGIYFIYRIKKIEVLTGYAAVSLLLFGGQALLRHTSLINILGYFSYFYIFVMLIEPRTTPISKTGKYIFGCGAAALIFTLTAMGARFDVELLSLLAMNMSVVFLNKLTLKGVMI